MRPKINFVVLTLSTVLSAACNAGSGGGSTVVSSPGNGQGAAATSTSAVAPASAVISANDKPLDVMLKAMRAQLDAKSYRAHVTTSSATGSNGTMVIEFAAPDRYHMVRESENKKSEMEAVIANGWMYLKGPNGRWIKSPVNASEMTKMIRDPKMMDELTKTADVTFVGPDMLDGAPMLVYQYTQTNPMGLNMKSVAKTWVAVADGLPRKTESEGEFNGVKSKTLITISDYNSDIKIDSPAN